VRIFTPDDLRQIEKAIAEAESKTSGELVVLAVPASGEYGWVHWLWGAIGWLIASVVLFTLTHYQDWGFAITSILRWQVVGMIAASAIGFIPAVQRWSVPDRVVTRRVHRECLANFLACGLHQTREHTGILIYLSERERRVEILADHGIHLKSGQKYWQERIAEIAQGLRQGQPAPALCQSIRDIGMHLATHFPAKPEDGNQVSNAVRLGIQDMRNEDDGPGT
jgi:putative membrane protein